MIMTKEQTQEFVDAWNIKSGYPLGEETTATNMRYSSPGVVTWNEYNAEQVDIKTFVEVYNNLFLA